MIDNHPNDFTPILKLEETKSPNWYRVYVLQNGTWERKSKHRNDLHAFINKDVREASGAICKITFRRKVIYETKVVKMTPRKGEK